MATSHRWRVRRAMLTPPTVWCALVPSRSQPRGYKIEFDGEGEAVIKADPEVNYLGGLLPFRSGGNPAASSSKS